MHPFMHSDSSKNVASKWENEYIFKLCQYINQKPNFESLWVLKKFNHLLLLQNGKFRREVGTKSCIFACIPD